jgi:hypothetical protein
VFNEFTRSRTLTKQKHRKERIQDNKKETVSIDVP